ncbi:MAG: export ABC transporter ATP-binding protein [Coprothermobacter sp.]|nr:export ABC transporter ATP-binding protein [Coprothermobacter sp.]
MLVEVKDLTKRFGKLTAVDGVHFSIPAGEAFGLLGPNGAGKTTTVSMMCGLVVPSSGDVVIDGHSILRDPMAVRRLIGVVPQDIALYPTLSARENLTFFARMQDVPASMLASRVDAVLDIVQLADRQKDRIETYSGGMKRRINIAVGLLNQPKLLILDEPTVGVDPQSRNSILATLKELNHQGMTLLYTSHYMEEVEFLCTHIAIIDHGKVIADGTQKDLRLQAGNKDIISVQLVREADGAVRDRLAALPGVDTVELRDKTIHIATDQGRSLLAGIISTLDDAGCPVSTIDVKEPNLEDLFLNLTGTSLRD